MGTKLNVPVIIDALKRTMGTELKNIDDPSERMKLLKEQLFLTTKHNLQQKNILLIDDVYRSGSTLIIATDVLYKQAKVKNVYVLTMTKTRSKT